ncbi:surfeit locus protein 6-domain-containing protein [Mucor mucedo]|uniref:surfeit locus protein 6-domain-containing protein n=1 Tax=Mucor mucedo TaxID=29922 RepID=UPI00221FB005|nr:surfeit locus protein 6-domain-containing protein [Mucor mucedo]KAI7896170.1 surfeit locus protein 6-domain-containing protein [Mucor mucedo]
MVQNHTMDVLSERLSRDVQIFDNLLKLIPAKFYVMDKNDDASGKFQHNKRKKAPKQAIKDRTKKAKKAKLDPTNIKSIGELQEEKAKQLIEEQENKSESDEEEDDEEESSDADEEQIEKMDVETGAFSGLDDSTPALAEATTTVEEVNLQPMEKSDIDQLRNRLQARISQLREKRNAPGANTANPRSRDDILAARNKKKEDRKKAIKAQKEKGGKVASEELVKFDDRKPVFNQTRPSADSVKMDGDLYFGKLAVGATVDQKKKKGPTDAKTQLKMLEAKQEKLEKMKGEDKSKAEELMEKEEWNKVLALATGEKLKDDTKLLKKTIKRQEKLKNKSGQEWNKRIEKVKYDEKKHIKKREENIKSKIDEKMNKKRGIKVKPAPKKARPGFEGAKRSNGGKVSKPSPPTKKGKK